MKTDEIQEYIDRLNNNDFNETIFLRPINEFVSYAQVWNKIPKLNDKPDFSFKPYSFYFIKNENKTYIGAVLDMNADLHWYINKDHRKKGYLIKALKEAIIPHLFDHKTSNNIIKISINKEEIGKENYLNSKKVAELSGFVPINKEQSNFTLTEKIFDWDSENIKEQNTYLSDNRLNLLLTRLSFCHKDLMRISNELTISYDNDKNLADLVKKIGNMSYKIEDLVFENREQQS
jgi:hypothetical protein